MHDEYLSAQEAARLLGVSVETLYAYVSRKGVRSQKLAGSRSHRYWRADIERLRRRERKPAALPDDIPTDSRITLLTSRGPYYRGRGALDLAAHASFEAVASLLWDVDEDDAFGAPPAPPHPRFDALDALLAGGASADRVIAHLAYFERANPRSFDLTDRGMARTGTDIIRWLTALFLHRPMASALPIHEQFATAIGGAPDVADLARRALVLAADHGFEQSTFAVRAVASTGVTPWRSVATGLAVGHGRRSRTGSAAAIARLVAEIVATPDPDDLLMARLRDGDPVPGFRSDLYPLGDPRAAALLGRCDAVFADDPRRMRLRRAFDFMAALDGGQPNFQLTIAVLSALLDSTDDGGPTGIGSSLFSVGRAAGWLAHAAEQFAAGEAGHRQLVYKGLMPDILTPERQD